MARAIMDDCGHSEFGLFEKLGDGDELRVVFALFGPMNADEGIVVRCLDAHDRAARRAAFDGEERDGHRWVHAEKLSGSGEDRFSWHGRPHNRVEKPLCAKGKQASRD